MNKQVKVIDEDANINYIWGYHKTILAIKWNEFMDSVSKEDRYNKDKLYPLVQKIGNEYIQYLNNLCTYIEFKDSNMNKINIQPFERFKELEDSLSTPEAVEMIEQYGREDFFSKVIELLNLFKEIFRDYKEYDLLSMSEWLKFIYKYEDCNNNDNAIIYFSNGIIMPENRGMLGFEYFMSQIDNIHDEIMFNKIAPIALQVLNEFGHRKKHILEKMLCDFIMSDSINLKHICYFHTAVLEVYSQAKEILSEDEELEIYYNLIYKKERLINALGKELICKKYENTKDKEIEVIINNINKNGTLAVYNYDFMHKTYDIDVFRDESNQMFYIYYKGRKMYFPQKFTNENDIKSYYTFIMKEQDINSPHRYETEGMEVEEHSILIDAGVAEGNFALDVLDRVDKIYLLECDPDWVNALRQTFKGEDKVIIIDKMLSNKQDDLCIDIDSIMNGEMLNYLKMDIEGSELDALAGAKETLKNSVNCKCNICAYHKSGDDEKITKKLNEYGFNTFPGKGYMFFVNDIKSYVNLEFRRGLIKGVKNNCKNACQEAKDENK